MTLVEPGEWDRRYYMIEGKREGRFLWWRRRSKDVLLLTSMEPDDMGDTSEIPRAELDDWRPA